MRTLKSIVKNTKDKTRLEIIIRADNDDIETLTNMSRIEAYKQHFEMKIIVDDRWGGYADMDKILRFANKYNIEII